jgi:cell division protein FtsZ
VQVEVKPEPKPVNKPIYVKPETRPIRKEETPLEERSYTLDLFSQEPVNRLEDDSEEEEDESMDNSRRDDDEFEVGKEISADQVINEEGLMELRKTKQRLEQQARERREKLKAARKQEMSKEEFNEKWTLPAYLRRGVKMENAPHSSDRFISKYNLNDDNNLLGNNKFLHDNVD